MAIIRDKIFPAVWKTLSGLGMTQRGIRTHEIKVYADWVAGVILDIIADMHMGWVHRDINLALRDSQKKSREIIGNTPTICLDLWDRLTLGTARERPTNSSDLSNLWPYFDNIAQKSDWERIWWVNGNHDKRMTEKMTLGELDWLNDTTREIWFRQILSPIELAGWKIRIQGMPCYNTQRELYTHKSIRELISNINSHSGVNIVMVHSPDGVRQIEEIKQQPWLRIDVPTLFLCGHTHGLLGFGDVPIIGEKLSNGARKWIGMERDTPYISGYYPGNTGEPYGTFVSQGMGDQGDIFRILSGWRERPLLRFVEEAADADIVLG